MTAITKLHSSPDAALQPTRFTQSREPSGEVTVHTIDKDSVTLSTSSSPSLSGSAAAASSTEVSIGTSGDVSKRERKEVEKAIQTFQEVTMDVLYGQVVTAVAHARQIEKPDPINGVSGASGIQSILTASVDMKV
jgi:hypothetical protein